MSNKHLFLPWLNVNNTPSSSTEPTSLSADCIRHQLITQLEHVLGYLLPQGRIRGNQFEVGDIYGNKGDSLKIEMQGNKAGFWHDFATHEGGDIIDLWAVCHQLNANTDFQSVLRSAHAWLVMQDNNRGSSSSLGLGTNAPSHQPTTRLLPAYTIGQLLSDTSPMPEDLIAPRVLTPSGLMVLGGAPKVGKSHFLLSFLSHMAAGLPFLGLTPPRPLKVFYLQTEVGYHYLRERLQQNHFDEKALPLVSQNLVLTPQSTLLLNNDGVNTVAHTICSHFDNDKVDIIAIDPLRNVFDSSSADEGENNNTSMLFFLQQRLDALRQAVNPDAGVILAHHTRKIQKQQLQSDPFQTLSGASSLRSYYTTGLLLFKDNENPSQHQLLFELRNGRGIKTKLIDTSDGKWQEIDATKKPVFKNKRAEKYNAERRQKYQTILNILREQALTGHIYTINQFCYAFDGKAGLGGINTIRNQLNALASKGYVKFFRDGTVYGLPNPTRAKFGFLCVKNMYINDTRKHTDTKTNQKNNIVHRVIPTHYKCKKTGNVMPINDTHTWEQDQKENLS